MLRMGAGHHTLTCGACGAPLSSLKAIPTAPVPKQPAVTHQGGGTLRKLPMAVAAKPRKSRKKRKGLFRKLAEEAFDFAEDAFDLVEDIFD